MFLFRSPSSNIGVYLDILDSVDKVKDFVREVSKFETDIDLVSSRFIVDAKSLMGILSLDLTKPIEVRILNKQDERLINTIEKYAVA